MCPFAYRYKLQNYNGRKDYKQLLSLSICLFWSSFLVLSSLFLFFHPPKCRPPLKCRPGRLAPSALQPVRHCHEYRPDRATDLRVNHQLQSVTSEDDWRYRYDEIDQYRLIPMESDPRIRDKAWKIFEGVYFSIWGLYCMFVYY